MPRDANRGSSKIVDQTVLESVSLGLEPEIYKLLKKFDRALVVVDSCKLNAGRVNNRDIFVINAVIYKCLKMNEEK